MRLAAQAAAKAAEEEQNEQYKEHSKIQGGGRSGKNGPPKNGTNEHDASQPAPVQISSLIANNKPGFQDKKD